MNLRIGLLLLLATTANAADKPNILFIAVDDLRPNLGCYGDAMAKSPNIDALAKTGTVFNRAYCQQAVCSPTRSSLLTGRRPDTTKVYDLFTHFRDHIPDVVTLPQHFKDNGYETRGIGKIYHGGYDDAKSWTKPHENGGGRSYGTEGQRVLALAKKKWDEEGRKSKNKTDQPRGPAWEAADAADGDLNDGKIADGAIRILNDVKDKPFFLAVGFLKPHLPFVAPKKYWDMHDPVKLPKADNPYPPKDAPKLALMNWGELRAYYEIPPDPKPVSAEQERKLVHGYYASVSYMDAQVGRVLAELDRLKLRDNTIIVLWGDHGWQLGEHGMWCKHTNYETSTRSTLILAAPGQKAKGATANGLVEFVDVYPTLTELAKLPKSEELEGMSFAPLLDDPKKDWKKAAFSQYPRGGGAGVGRVMGYAMRTDRYRFVAWEAPKGDFAEYELYDHQVDPGENVNIAKKPDNAELVKKMREQLKAGWMAAKP